jgi:hypothetical protein
MTSDTSREVKWAALLKEAAEKPGMILEAYSTFHGLCRVLDYSERSS